ncbi:MAG: hypothetical protein HYY28_09765 [Betaproteobacteria bacterium]|nr:hypothetical protein [Betaproteobacteria bacterium]MBI2960589.1 hypothetical protein [Betaproteobacteria bacterium]
MEQLHSIPERRCGTDIGIAAVEHERLNALADELKHAIAQGREEDSERLLNLLLGETRNHFAHEERLLAQAAYPLLAGHAAVHSQITWEMEHAISALRQSELSAERSEYGLLVEQLIAEHTIQETRVFERFLRPAH